MLRLTLLYTIAHELGVQYALALSGYRSTRYIWRYVQPDAQRLADTLDALDTPTVAREDDARFSTGTGMEALAGDSLAAFPPVRAWR